MGRKSPRRAGEPGAHSSRPSAPRGAPSPANAPPTPATFATLRTLWPIWAVLVACIWFAFSPVLNNGFVDWDDPAWIVENHAFRGLGWEQVEFAFTSFMGGVYQPLGWLVQSLTYAIFGLDPRGYHRVSLLCHVVNVVLLHLLCVRLIERSMPEAAIRLGAALGWLCALPVACHAVHPLRVEMVAWASCQGYLPSISFSLLATLAYLKAHPPGGAFRRSWMIGSSVLIVLAVLSKGSAVVLPVVFLILDAYPLGRLGRENPFWPTVRALLFEKGPILVFCLVFMAVAFAAKRSGVDPETTAQSVVVARVAQASFGAWFYVVKSVWPFGLSAYYPRPETGDFLTPLFAACFAGSLLALSAAVWLRRKRPWLLAGLAAYLVLAAPYLGLARVGVTLAADRYAHGPTLAWVVLGCAGLCKLGRRGGSRAALFGACASLFAVVCGLMPLCSAQCRVWDGGVHLWRQALEHAPWSSEPHHFLGSALAEEGHLDAAIAEFREALRIRPHDFESTCDLGVALDRKGETDAAVVSLREAVRLRPHHARACLNLGGALVHQGHVDEAIALDREAVRSHPNDPDLRFSLGVALLRQRKIDAAIDELKKAIELRPWYTEAYTILGGAHVLEGRQEAASAVYQKALDLDPDQSVARIGLGLALARQGRSAAAIAELREAVKRDRTNPETHHVLGAVLVAAGQTKEAAAEFQEVLRLRPDHAQSRVFLDQARVLRK